MTVRIGYVIGMGRSGSTLLDRLAGMNPGVVSLGEAPAVWGAGVLRNVNCSCGEAFSECPLWLSVAAADPDLLTKENAEVMIGVVRSLLPAQGLRRLLTRRGRARVAGSLPPRYLENLQRLYRALGDATGSTAILDSTKNPAYGLALLELKDVDVRFIRLTRDPRGVVYSLSRVKVDPSATKAAMRRYGPFKGALYWNIMNAAADAVTSGHPAVLELAYEALVADPEAVMNEVLAFLGVEQAPALANSFHILGGNPSRFASEVVVQPDDEWKDRMPRLARSVTTAATLPLMRRYGYRV